MKYYLLLEEKLHDFFHKKSIANASANNYSILKCGNFSSVIAVSKNLKVAEEQKILVPILESEYGKFGTIGNFFIDSNVEIVKTKNEEDLIEKLKKDYEFRIS